MKISIHFFLISNHFDTYFAFVGGQNKKVINFYLVAEHSKAIGAFVCGNNRPMQTETCRLARIDLKKEGKFLWEMWEIHIYIY